jgi:hypothetical protein
MHGLLTIAPKITPKKLFLSDSVINDVSFEWNFLSCFLNFYSLPMMFGGKLKRRDVIRDLIDVFGVCSAGICRLGKKIGC